MPDMYILKWRTFLSQKISWMEDLSVRYVFLEDLCVKAIVLRAEAGGGIVEGGEGVEGGGRSRRNR